MIVDHGINKVIRDCVRSQSSLRMATANANNLQKQQQKPEIHSLESCKYSDVHGPTKHIGGILLRLKNNPAINYSRDSRGNLS